MKKQNTKEENRSQAEAFRRMPGNEQELIQVYAADFRDIISEFEAAHGRVPTHRRRTTLAGESAPRTGYYAVAAYIDHHRTNVTHGSSNPSCGWFKSTLKGPQNRDD